MAAIDQSVHSLEVVDVVHSALDAGKLWEAGDIIETRLLPTAARESAAGLCYHALHKALLEMKNANLSTEDRTATCQDAERVVTVLQSKAPHSEWNVASILHRHMSEFVLNCFGVLSADKGSVDYSCKDIWDMLSIDDIGMSSIRRRRSLRLYTILTGQSTCTRKNPSDDGLRIPILFALGALMVLFPDRPAADGTFFEAACVYSMITSCMNVLLAPVQGVGALFPVWESIVGSSVRGSVQILCGPNRQVYHTERQIAEHVADYFAKAMSRIDAVDGVTTIECLQEYERGAVELLFRCRLTGPCVAVDWLLRTGAQNTELCKIQCMRIMDMVAPGEAWTHAARTHLTHTLALEHHTLPPALACAYHTANTLLLYKCAVHVNSEYDVVDNFEQLDKMLPECPRQMVEMLLSSVMGLRAAEATEPELKRSRIASQH